MLAAIDALLAKAGSDKTKILRAQIFLADLAEAYGVDLSDGDIEPLVRNAEWRELFVERARDFRIVVLGHAVLEQALERALELFEEGVGLSQPQVDRVAVAGRIVLEDRRQRRVE